MILTSTEGQIKGYWITAYKGIVQGQTWDELLRQAKEVGANAVLNTCFDDALDVDALFHGAAVVMRRQCLTRRLQADSNYPKISDHARRHR